MVQFTEFQENARRGAGGGAEGYSAKRSSDPRVAYHEVEIHVRDLVRVVSIVAPLPHLGSVFGVIRFIELQGVNGDKRPVSGAPSSGTPRESQTKFRDGTVWGF